MNGIIIRLILLLICAVTLSGCLQPSIRFLIQTPSTLNLNSHHQPESVVLRVYELTEPQLFWSAPHDSLVLNEQVRLQNSVIAQHEKILSPSDSTVWRLALNKKTRYLGLLLLPRNPKLGHWRRVILLPPIAAAKLSDIRVTADQQQLNVKVPSWWHNINSFGRKDLL